MKTLAFLILMVLPVVVIGQVTASTSVHATITSVESIESFPDSVNLHFRVRSSWNYLMNLAITNEYGTSFTNIMSSPSTDLFLTGRKTPGLVIIFNYN